MPRKFSIQRLFVVTTLFAVAAVSIQRASVLNAHAMNNTTGSVAISIPALLFQFLALCLAVVAIFTLWLGKKGTIWALAGTGSAILVVCLLAIALHYGVI